MKSSPHRPLILKRRKLSLPHTEAFNALVRNESDGQTAGSSKQEQARTDEPDVNRKEPAIRDVSTRIRIIDHPTLSDAQVVAVPTSTDIQSILEALAAKGKESGSNGPNKFILISNGSRSSSMKSRAFQDLFKSEDEHITTNSTAQEEATCIGQSSGTVERPTFRRSESLSAGGQEQERNSNGEAPSCGLDNSLTNIQWLGKITSNELSPCSVKKETEKENQTPKQRTVKCEEGLAPSSSSATTWQEPFSERPPYSYMAMIQFAINSTEKKRMMLKDIYTWIEDHFPYFKHVAKPGWKNSIRHNLSLHEMFVRETSANGKISFWTIHPEANRYLTLDQVFKQQKRHSLELQKDMGGSRGSKSETQTTCRRMKPLLPRVNSYLVPIQFPVSQSLLLPSSSKAPLPIAKSASGNMQSSRRVRIAPKVLPSSEEPVLFPAAVSVKEEACCDEGPCPLAAHQRAKEDACQISRASLPAAPCIKEERGSFHPNPLSPSFLPALPVKEEPALNLGFPAAPVKQKRPFMALKSPPQSTLDLLVIKTQEEQAMGRRSRRKQPLARPCSEEPVLLLPGGGGSHPDSLTLRPDLPEEREIPPQGNVSNFRCFQEEGGPFRTPMKEMSCKLPISSTPGRKASGATPTALGSADPWGLAPFVKETSNPDFSPVRNPPLPLLSLQENWDLLGFSSPPLSVTPLCDSPQLALLNAEANDMVSRPLTSSPAPSEQPSPERGASVLPERHSLLEGLVLDTMNDSLSKILLDVSFPGPEDDLSTDFSWSQLIPELK